MDKDKTATAAISEIVIEKPDDVSVSVLKFIAYFDVFEFPLTKKELINFCGKGNSPEVFSAEINQLIQSSRIHSFENYYFLPGRKQIIAKRKENEKRAGKYFSKIPVWVRLIARFPFVRSVCISGSLSKGTMPEKGDVDYFIITEPGKLWICRTLLILFKKIFLLNSKKYFCVNYFLDTNNPEVPDKNIFTATEIVFLLPVAGDEYYQKFIQSNNWVKEYYPGFIHPFSLPVYNKKPWVRIAFEYLIDNRIGDRLDDYFMKITLKRWKKKFPQLKGQDFEIAMRTRKNVSKHHPNHFQEKVMAKYLSNLGETELITGISNFK